MENNVTMMCRIPGASIFISKLGLYPHATKMSPSFTTLLSPWQSINIHVPYSTHLTNSELPRCTRLMVEYCKKNWHLCCYIIYDLQASKSGLHKNSDRAVGQPGIPGKPRKNKNKGSKKRTQFIKLKLQVLQRRSNG